MKDGPTTPNNMDGISLYNDDHLREIVNNPGAGSVGSSRKEAEDSPADGQLLENIVPGNGPIASSPIIDAATEPPRYIPLAIRHDEIEVSRHQRLLKTKFCRYGPNCEFARKGQCFYVHTPQELKYRPPKPQDYPYSRDRHDTGYSYYTVPYTGAGSAHEYSEYDDDHDDFAGYYQYDHVDCHHNHHPTMVNDGESRLEPPYPTPATNPRGLGSAQDAGMLNYYDDYANDYYHSFTAAATVRPSRQTATSTATTSTTPASCSSPMLVRNSDTTSEEPALRAMEIAIQIRDFAKSSDGILLLLQALSILGTTGDATQTNKNEGLVDGPAASIMNPLLTALTAFYATTTTYADGDHHDPPTPNIPPGLSSSSSTDVSPSYDVSIPVNNSYPNSSCTQQ